MGEAFIKMSKMVNKANTLVVVLERLEKKIGVKTNLKQPEHDQQQQEQQQQRRIDVHLSQLTDYKLIRSDSSAQESPPRCPF